MSIFKNNRQILFSGGFNQTILGGATNYLNPVRVDGLLGASGRSILIPEPVTFANLSITINSAQPGSGSLVVTLQIVAPLTNLLSITIPAGAAAFTLFSNPNTSGLVVAGSGLTIELINNAAVASAQIGPASITMNMI